MDMYILYTYKYMYDLHIAYPLDKTYEGLKNIGIGFVWAYGHYTNTMDNVDMCSV